MGTGSHLKGGHLWQLVVLWLGDMPAALRQAVGFLRLASLDGRFAFSAAIDDLIATTPEAVAGADAGWSTGSTGCGRSRWQMLSTPPVPAVLDLPEAPSVPDAPYILITPWSSSRSATPAVSSTWSTTRRPAGGFVRSAPAQVELIYRVDVWTDGRTHKAFLLDRIVPDLLEPLVVVRRRVRLEPISAQPAGARRPRPAGSHAALLPPRAPGRDRRPELPGLAVPLLLVGDINDRSNTEALGL